jgi:Kef-type K+ transport system membrane component KefB
MLARVGQTLHDSAGALNEIVGTQNVFTEPRRLDRSERRSAIAAPERDTFGSKGVPIPSRSRAVGTMRARYFARSNRAQDRYARGHGDSVSICTRLVCASAAIACAWLHVAQAHGQDFDQDAGSDDDAGAPVAAAPLPPPSSQPAVTLPPAEPARQIAPIVDEPPSVVTPEVPIETSERPAVVLKTIVGLLCLITLAYLGGQPRVLALERKLGISQVITAGFPFVLLGWVARSPAIGLLNDELLFELSPLLRVGLGYIGFAAGFRFSLEVRPRSEIMRTAFYATAVPFAFVALTSGVLLLWMSGDVSGTAASNPVFLRDAFTLGTAGAMTATTSASMSRRRKGGEALGAILRFEELAGIVCLAVIAAYFRPRVEVSWQLPGTAWLLLTLGLGATLGLISYLVLNRPQEGPEFVLLTLGLIGFSAGTAGYLRLSPIVIAFIAGTFLVLLPPVARTRLGDALRRLERPVYLLSLTVIGALWQIDDWRGWALVPVFVGARLLGKRAAVTLADRFSGHPLTGVEQRALAIAPIGPLAIAIVVNAQLLYPGGSISPIVAAVIVGGVLTEIFVQLASRRPAVESETAARGES